MSPTGEQPDITVTFTTTASEHVRATRTVLLRTVSGWILFALFVLVPLAQLPFIEVGPGEGAWVRWLPLVLAGVGLASWYLFAWVPVLVGRRGVRDPNGPHTLALSHSLVVLQSPHARVEWDWGAFLRVRETADFFLLYFAKSGAQYVPKRAVPPDQMETMRQLFAERVSPGTHAKVDNAG